MIIIKKVDELKAHLRSISSPEKSLGFVPTMGALHEGHLSLITTAKSYCSTVVASVFVNPTQFNDRRDLERYPRNPEKDAELLASAGCDILFLPSEEEIYPSEPFIPEVDLKGLDQVMEGQFRPGHFKGVVTVVYRLFDIVKPDYAFFGDKDFQQLAIIKRMTKELELPIEIIGCPIFREKSGLAMSSRNELLDPEDRKNAGVIYQILKKIPFKVTDHSVKEVVSWATAEFSKQKLVSLEYFNIVDPETLQPITSWDGNEVVACFAGFVGKIRLIDNIYFKRK